MKRTLRRACQTTIQYNEAEDESNSDDDYIPEKIVKVSQTRKKAQTVKDEGSTKISKKKANTLSLPKRNRQKVTELKSTNSKIGIINTDIKELIVSQEGEIDKKSEKEDVGKENAKYILKDGRQLDLTSIECKDWTEVDYVSEVNNVEKHITKNVIKLFKEDNTIPFIARYRKNMTGGMEPDKLRALKESFDRANLIKQKANTIIKAIDKLGKWSPNIHAAIVSAKSMDDLEHIYSIFKIPSKRNLAEKAKELGLEPISNAVLQGQSLPHLKSLVNPEKEGLKTEQQIKDGIIHIIADTINKDKSVFERVRELQNESIIKIETTECKTNKTEKTKEKDVDRKYEMYYNFNATTRTIRPHQILAINRGEAQKVLNVKIILPDFLLRQFKAHCTSQYNKSILASKFHAVLLNDSIDYAYSKFTKPFIVRRVRNEMKQKAETASIEVFVRNVKQLLLTPPVRGKIILGIDPGFFHGCKLAVISEHGNVLETSVIYPHKKAENSYKESANVLVSLVKKHKSTILALGNATACRETEVFINQLIKSKAFGSIDVVYTIVDESGASIYSCSPEAKSEFPDLDTNVISAISIARRLQDPLAELVKVEPKHLGVGMYQHDVPEKQLLEALNEVVSEAVSFVGVDVNTASQCLLRRVAGLNATRANNIIEWRTEHGAFKNRQQLLSVRGIGNKTFEQCAGFIRILPETSMVDNSEKKSSAKNSKQAPSLLDQTWIHPESYKIAQRFLEHCNCNLENLGTTAFIERINSFANEGCDTLAKKFNTDETTMEVIVKGLSMKKDEDIRLKEAKQPLFRNTMLSIKDINVGTILTGAVRNITHFGVFVDVGVGRDGLIATKWMKNLTVSIGQRVEVKVLTVEVNRNRISLELINVF
ncbi:S1 RNA-binding domain-containing protein 1 [Calliopsis andreniformis]|uniref:S1 RNA-binding domain-containing protein 1 n=1 Tax=Calliopsis andreniformis TaxID=337506 RepID=UPI003FCCC712